MVNKMYNSVVGVHSPNKIVSKTYSVVWLSVLEKTKEMGGWGLGGAMHVKTGVSWGFIEKVTPA